MKFVVRAGTDPEGRADSALLTAMGLPGGGVVKIENTHVLVRPGDVASPNALLLSAPWQTPGFVRATLGM